VGGYFMDKDIAHKVEQFFRENPKFLGIFVILVGIFILMASIFNWNWIFSGHSWNLKKIEGISNFFGRGIARLFFGIGGIGIIILGIILVILL
jgi:hypothetical protein